MQKFLILSVSFCLMFAFAANAALAVDDNGTINSALNPPAVITTSAPVENIPPTINTEKQLVNLLKQAAQLIKDRLNALTKTNRSIQFENIADKLKTELKNEISQQAKSLNGLSAQIKSTTDVNAIKSQQYDFLLANLANADMLGHTGVYEAVVKGVEVVDEVVGEIMKTVLEENGALIITADHGNAEKMIDFQTGEPDPEHTTNPVPVYLIMNSLRREKSSGEISALKKNISGLVTDVAATVLDLMRIPVPGDMDGKSLLPMLYKQ